LIEFVLAHADLARVRFAHSPLRELVASLRTLRDPQRQQVYHKWLSAVSGRLAGLDMELLTALAPVGPHMYDFLLPHLDGPSAALSNELEAVTIVSPDVVRDDLEHTAQGRPIPQPLRPLYEDPAAELPHVVDELAKYFRAAVEPFWPQVQSIITADLIYRMEQFAAGGVANVLSNLHPEIAFKADRLFIDKRHHCSHRFDLTGQGIVLVPSAFSWPALLVGCCDLAQPSLNYPPRGVADIGGDPHADQSNSLVTLVGRTKITLLTSLEYPKTTTQLAKDLDISPAAVSQHLKVLKATGMAAPRRRGRAVLYQRTPAASALLTSIHADGKSVDSSVY
jgi:DNA-binding transcriptional ArsR family regulator